MKDTLLLVRLAAIAVAIALIPTLAVAQSPTPRASSAPRPTFTAPVTTSVTPAPAPWVPEAAPTLPADFQIQAQSVAWRNLLREVFNGYCTERGDVISKVVLNEKPDAPVYPATVVCVRTRLRVDSPSKVTKL